MRAERLQKMWMPQVLVDACEGDRELLAWAETLRASWQREISTWLGEAKHEQTRIRRAMQMAERLLATMEAERELPDLIARPLDKARGARQGWERMSLDCRRTYLLVIFGARSPEAREHQIVRLVDACAVKGTRSQSRAGKIGE